MTFADLCNALVKFGRHLLPGKGVLSALLLLAGALNASLALAAPSQYCVAPNGASNQFLTIDSANCDLCGYGIVTLTIRNRYQAGTQDNYSEAYDDSPCGGGDCTRYRNNPQFGASTADSTLRFTGTNDIVVDLGGNLGLYTGVAATGGTAVAAGSTVNIQNVPNVAPGTTHTITFPVHALSNPEALYNAGTPAISAAANYTTTCTPARENENFSGALNPQPAPVFTPDDDVNGTVAVNRPQLNVNKRGWNVDAGQTEVLRTAALYGHNDDDVIWRLNIGNGGAVGAQDMRVDDVLSRADLLNASYVCPTPAAATAIANANGTLPAGSTCVPVQNVVAGTTVLALSDWSFATPFGSGSTPARPDFTPNAGVEDVNNGANINLYVVGKIRPSGSSVNAVLTNTFSDVEFGCSAQPGAGGIDPGLTSAATLTTYYTQGNSALRITRNLTGLTQTPLGTRGLMTITLENQGHGTVIFGTDDDLRDILPPGYVVDPNYMPQVQTAGANVARFNNVSLFNNAAYAGKVDTLTWTNPAAGTYPISTSSPTPYLNNTAPTFKLSSSSGYTDSATGSTYQHLMRQGDVITIRFAVVLKDPNYYDRKADLDVPEEAPGAAAQNTDPTGTGINARTNLRNDLLVKFTTLDSGQGTFRHTLRGNGATANPTNNGTDGTDNIIANPEDLDVLTVGDTFVLTNDPNQTLPLPVRVDNRGGNAARDFSVFVTFGPTMTVTNVAPPASYRCDAVTPAGTPPQPAPYKVWVQPIPLPTDGTVYRCYPDHANALDRNLAPGASVVFDFTVRKVQSGDANYAARLAADDLTFRADVIGEIYTTAGLTFSDNTANPPTVTAIANGPQSWFPTPGDAAAGNRRADNEVDRGNNYSLDAYWARVIGFNLKKNQVDPALAFSAGVAGLDPALGACSENTPASYTRPTTAPTTGTAAQLKDSERVQIGEECTVRIQTGGWFGFRTRGFSFIGVRDAHLRDVVQDGLVYVSNTNPVATSHPTILGVTMNPALAPLAEGEFGWRFNGGAGDFIVQRDQWFTLNATTRIENKAQDNRAAPNVQSADRYDELQSNFEAVFQNDNTGQREVYRLGDGQVGRVSPNPAIGPGPTTGYPNQPIRRVDVTVTEPNITLSKQVCDAANFTAATGACAGNWQNAINSAATSSSYVYRLVATNCLAANVTSRNTASANVGCTSSDSNGQPLAPAYDLVVTDRLDASDLMLVVDMATDGIDNDGDGQIDEADEGGVGPAANFNIDNNTVADIPLAPATVTFSYKRGVDGRGLRRIDAGASAYMYYRADPDQRIAPGQTIANSVSAAYDSLEGADAKASGNQTVATRPNGDLAGARQYSSNTASATLTFIPPQVNPKTITRLSTVTGPLPSANPYLVKIGEEIEYTLTAQLPVTQLRNLTVTDVLPAGLLCIYIPPVDFSVAPYAAGGVRRVNASGGLEPMPVITPACSGQTVTWNFGNVSVTSPDTAGGQRFTFPLTFIARVANVAGNNGQATAGATALNNGAGGSSTATLTYANAAGVAQPALTYTNTTTANARVAEPLVSFTKTWTPPRDAGDVITVTVVATNTGPAPAYNLRIRDNLVGSGMTYIGNVAGAGPPDSVNTTLYGANQPVFVWSASNALAAGASRTFTFQVRVDGTVQPLQQLTNSITGDWTSLESQAIALTSPGRTPVQIGANGAADGQRIGSLDTPSGAPTPAINDYQAGDAIDTPAAIAAPAIAKTDLTAGQAVEIGSHRRFQIDINLPEGITKNLQVRDVLNSVLPGLVLANNATFDITYELTGIASINGTAVTNATAEGAMTAFPADGATGTVLWNIGEVVTTNENDLPTAGALNPRIRITYSARVNNDAVTDRGANFRNSVQVDYTNGQTNAAATPLTATTTQVTAIEPTLTAQKTVAKITPGTLTTGSVLEFTIRLRNVAPSNATAYDVNIVDTLPSQLSLLGTPSVTIGGAAVPGFVALPAVSGQTLTWGRGNSDESLDIGVGQDLVLVFRAVVNGLGTGMVNNVRADWTSLQGASTYERTGSASPAYNDYFVSAQVAIEDALDSTRVVKAVVADTWTSDGSNATDGIARVGDTVDYQLTLTLNEGTTHGLTLADTLQAGLVFDSIVRVGSDSAAPFNLQAPFATTVVTGPANGQAGILTFTLGDVNNTSSNGTPDNIVIVYRARVATSLAQAPTTALQNSVVLSRTTSTGVAIAGVAGQTDAAASITVRQPGMSAITKTDRTPRASPYTVVNLAADTMLFRLRTQNDGLAPAYNLLFTDSVPSQLNYASVTTPVVTLAGTPLTAGQYTYQAPTTGNSGALSVRLNVPVLPGQAVTVDYNVGFNTNVAPNQSWSNTVAITEYWSLPAPLDGNLNKRYAPTETASFVMTNPVLLLPVPTKTLVSPATKATIGEEVEYRITVPGTAINAALNNVAVTDTLPVALQFVSATANAGTTLTDNASAGRNVNLAIASIPAGQQAVITLRARVVNTVDTNAGDIFNNVASYTYGGTTYPSAATANLTIAEPRVTLDKTIQTPPATVTAGTVLNYRLQLAAEAGANRSAANDLVIVDRLDLGLAYVAGSASLGNPVITGDGIITAQTLAWTVAQLAEGANLTVNYQVRVQNSVSPGQRLNNSAEVRWTSLAGASTYERNGSGTPALNDYLATDTTQSAATDSTTFAKARVGDTWNTANADLRVGDRVQFELRLGLQEGTHRGLVVTDTLPAGLAFARVVGVNRFGVAGTMTATASGQVVPFTLGDLVNAADGNAANDFVVITYEARVQNQSVLAQQPTSQVLANGATLTRTLPTGTAPPLGATASVTVLQPLLAVTAVTATTANGNDTVVTAGEAVTVTVDIRNNGQAPAYDVQVQDVLPVGLRAGGATTQSIALLSGASLPVVQPAYSAATGTALWNLDATNTYAIPVGDTLRLVYVVTGDAGIGAGLTLGNSVNAYRYHSFDNGDIPANGLAAERQVYGPSAAGSAALTTPAPGVLAKANTQATATIGERFAYRITVPAAPATTALYDVKIVDDLTVSAANLRFVSVRKISTDGTWVPVNTGDATHLVVADTANGGIDIPAGQQAVVEVVVELLDTPTNVAGLAFHNTASYSYSGVNGSAAAQSTTVATTSPDMTVVEPRLTLDKTGPATLRAGVDGAFTLNVQNTGTARAYDITLLDRLPDATPGGMCATAPVVTSARVFEADGTTPVSAVLVAGSDYRVSYDQASCTLSVTGLSAAAAPGPQQRLIVNYTARLDNDSVNNQTLTNIAGATGWFSQDTAGAGVTGATRAYTRTLTNGTPTTVDHEDAHTLTTETAVLRMQKRVLNVTTGQNPGTTARPGERLRYEITVSNTGAIPLSNFSVVDEPGALNATVPVFTSGSLRVTSVPTGADTTATQPAGGARGAGLLDVRGLSLGALGSGTDTARIVFEIDLQPVITSGTVVLNQARVMSYGNQLAISDDPDVNGVDDPATAGGEDATRTVIASAPAWQVHKTSQDLTGDVAVLSPGDRLRYTITVKNVGTENAIGVSLRDLVPNFTRYVVGSTTLNGRAVADVAGASPLQAGLLIHAPEDTTPGAMRPGASATTTNVATIVFDVQVNAGTLDGTLISNQGFVTGSGAGSNAFPEVPSDDPDTPIANDPTRDIVGRYSLLVAQKLVATVNDANGNGVLDPLDVVRYTITVNNASDQPAAGVVLTDLVPVNTTYVADTVTLNGAPVARPDGGVSPLATGVPMNSPAGASGTIAPRASAVITFDARVNAGVAAGTVISNQGSVASNGLPSQLTDADGNSANGYQPTTFVVGSAQQLAITKAVMVVGGGAAMPGSQLEYLVTVTNTGAVAATNVVLTDDLGAVPLASQVTYVAGSASLNGSVAAVSLNGAVLRADYAVAYGSLRPGASAQLRFRVQVGASLMAGTTMTNTAQVAWNSPSLTASASASLAVGAVPGAAGLNGRAWHDTNLNRLYDAGEPMLQGWTVDVLRNNVQIGTVTTDANGQYAITGLTPSATPADQLSLRFNTPGSGVASAKLGRADSAFVNGMQAISGITAPSGSNLQNLNLPLQPNGVVYDSITRAPVTGAVVNMMRVGSTIPLPASCFDDAAQQGQITPAGGYYKFDLNFSDASCPPGGDYLIQVTSPTNYLPGASRVIAPISDASSASFSVPSCPGSAADAITTTTTYCEAQASHLPPGIAVAAGTAGTNHYLNLALNNGAMPGTSQIYDNHIAIDPRLDNAVSISKVAALRDVTRGQLVPYTITVSNTLPATLVGLSVVDTFPAGFKYVPGSARLDDHPVEPVVRGNQLTWGNLQLPTNAKRVIKLVLIVGSGVSEGLYVNRAQVIAPQIGAASTEATATVRVIPDPTLDCSDVIGKVFEDVNLNGYQDDGEPGLPGVRLATATGLIVTTDPHGRFHLTCAVVPDADRGSNFILKVDDRTLPTGYRITTENPRVQRATRGKMLKFNFGAAIHRVVKLDVSDGVFEPGTVQMRVQWKQRMTLLLSELKKAPSVLRLSYLGETESDKLVKDRLQSLHREIETAWKRQGGKYDLTIETEVFWRLRAPR